MPDKFDPYREALVIEDVTEWTSEFDSLDDQEKNRIAEALHANAEQCSELEYVRQHTGFSRHITVTTDDVDRVKQ